MKNILKKLLDNSTQIILIIFIGACILGIIKLALQRIDDYLYKKVIYVYACPQNTQSSKCYKVRSDWVDTYEDEFPTGYFERIYFNNGGYVSFSSCDFMDKIYTCFPEKDSDGVWNLQISEVKKVRK